MRYTFNPSRRRFKPYTIRDMTSINNPQPLLNPIGSFTSFTSETWLKELTQEEEERSILTLEDIREDIRRFYSILQTQKTAITYNRPSFEYHPEPALRGKLSRYLINLLKAVGIKLEHKSGYITVLDGNTVIGDYANFYLVTWQE